MRRTSTSDWRAGSDDRQPFSLDTTRRRYGWESGPRGGFAIALPARSRAIRPANDSFAATPAEPLPPPAVDGALDGTPAVESTPPPAGWLADPTPPPAAGEWEPVDGRCVDGVERDGSVGVCTGSGGGLGTDTVGTVGVGGFGAVTVGTVTFGNVAVGTVTVGTDTVGTVLVGTDTVGTDTEGTETDGTDTEGTEIDGIVTAPPWRGAIPPTTSASRNPASAATKPTRRTRPARDSCRVTTVRRPLRLVSDTYPFLVKPNRRSRRNSSAG